MYNSILCQVCFLSFGMFIKNSKWVVYIWIERSYIEEEFRRQKLQSVDSLGKIPAIWLFVFFLG